LLAVLFKPSVFQHRGFLLAVILSFTGNITGISVMLCFAIRRNRRCGAGPCFHTGWRPFRSYP